MRNKKPKLLVMILTLLVVLLVSLMPNTAFAAVTYSDWRWSTPDVFYRGGSEWVQQSSGGYDNAYTYWKCYPANGWTYATLNGTREYGYWYTPQKPYYTGNIQAYITSYGTTRRCNYYAGYASYWGFNQYAVHGFCTLWSSTGGYAGSVYLSDFHDGLDWSSGQKVAYDAMRVYY